MLNKKIKADLTAQYGINAKDTGSSAVQAALLSERIRQISEHLKAFPKDRHSQLGLVKIVGHRKDLLNYLKKNDEKNYLKVTQQLKNSNYI